MKLSAQLPVISLATFLLLACPSFSFASSFSCSKANSQLASHEKAKVLDAETLLQKASEGKSFSLSAGASLVSLETNLVQLYGLNQSLKSIPSDKGRDAIGRVALMIENNYVIAAKMTLGASVLDGLIPEPILSYVSRYVSTMTEPYHEDAELLDLQRKSAKGIDMVRSMSPKPLAFARWMIYGSAWDDRIAMDAALMGFCSANPTIADLKLLNEAVDVSRLDRGSKYADPHSHGGALPVAPPRK